MTQVLTPPIARTFKQVPPLQNGDNLDAAEFHRRYMAMPRVKNAELIRGVVYISLPASLEDHGSPHADLIGWLGVYRASTPGVTAGDNSTVRLDDSNTPQPDACLVIRGGQTKLIDGYVQGPPEFVSEIAASTASYDLHQKKDVYAEFGVREYLVWRVFDGAIDWFVLKDGRYEPQIADAEGIIRSSVLPGLRLASESLLAGDLTRVHSVLHRGLADPSHAAFVAKLAAEKAVGQVLNLPERIA